MTPIRATSIVLAAAFLAGCQCAGRPRPDFDMTWYLLAEAPPPGHEDDVDPPMIYVTLLNRGVQSETVEEVVVNSSSTLAWRLKPRQADQAIEPGRVVVLDWAQFEQLNSAHGTAAAVTDTAAPAPSPDAAASAQAATREKQRCFLPVSITLRLKDVRDAIVSRSGSILPNALPPGWISHKCDIPGLSQAGPPIAASAAPVVAGKPASAP